MSKHYDYIVAGAGAAGLSLLLRMIASGRFSHKKILLVDRQSKNTNDRTWCFWEKGPGFFEEIVYKRWDYLLFYGRDFHREFRILPYQYKMIRGIDFYDHALKIIRSQDNITIRYGRVQSMQSDGAGTWIEIDAERITAAYIFNSIIFSELVPGKKNHLMLQHFTGWFIETAAPVFREDTATLMDFRVNQKHGTSFAYVMPFSSSRALVEYTLFTKQLLQPAEYEEALREYLGSILRCGYSVLEEEFGVIPMTDIPFAPRAGNIIQMGTAGGQTKASSGYTFQFIQKNAGFIVAALLKGDGQLKLPGTPAKFRFYDSVLLNVLATGKLPGDAVFTALFRGNPIQRVFQFLDNESSLRQDLQLIASLPVQPFLKAGWEQVVDGQWSMVNSQ